MSLAIFIDIPACEHCGRGAERMVSVRITHNLVEMATVAGVHEALWQDTEKYTRPRQIIPALEAGLAALEADPKRFRAFNPPNGWGSYEDFVEFVRELLQQCRQYPDGELSIHA